MGPMPVWESASQQELCQAASGKRSYLGWQGKGAEKDGKSTRDAPRFPDPWRASRCCQTRAVLPGKGTRDRKWL